jgi:hypothetical protein
MKTLQKSNLAPFKVKIRERLTERKQLPNGQLMS